MTDLVWVISSCVLILAVIAVRAAFGKKLSAGLRYALWGLVLLRLLVPGTIASSPVSIKSAVQSAEVVQNIEAVKDYSAITQTESGAVVGRLRRPTVSVRNEAEPGGVIPVRPSAQQPAAAPADEQTSVVIENATPERFERMRKTLVLRDILNIIWYTGMGLAAAYFIGANLRFYLKLRSRRIRLEAEAPCPVYSVKGLSSSCLFLNSIYISEETAKDERKLAYVLEHEKAHRRHGDGMIALLRSAALAIHWYNPLVWAAAFLSRRDSELFADSGAIEAVGESEREAYGATLIELSSKASVYAPIACAATMMTSSGRELKSRVKNIAARRKMGIAAAALACLLALTAVGCAFLGGKSGESDRLEDSACLEAAWIEAQRIAEAHGLVKTNEHGLTVKKENHRFIDMGSEYTKQIEFYSPDMKAPDAVIDLVLLGSDEDGWEVTQRILMLNAPGDVDEAAIEKDLAAVAWPRVTVTEAQLGEAVLSVSPDGAAVYAAYEAAKHLSQNCPEGNLFRCSGAEPVSVEAFERGSYMLTIAVRPENERVFYSTFARTGCMGTLLDGYAITDAANVNSIGAQHTAFDRCFTMLINAEVEPAGDDAFIVTLDTDFAPVQAGPDIDGAAAWNIDIDGDRAMDALCLDVNALAADGLAYPFIQLADGTQIILPPVATSHSGFGTYAVYEDAGRQMILEYRPSWYDGVCEDIYNVYTVENGGLKVLYSGGISFEVSSTRTLPPVNKANVLAFVDEINAVWEKSRMLFSTDTDIALKQTRTRAGSGEPYVAIAGDFYIQNVLNADENYYCYEQLERLEREFPTDGDGSSISAEDRLDAANSAMEEHASAEARLLNAFAIAREIADGVCREHGVTIDLESGTISRSLRSDDYTATFVDYYEGTQNAQRIIRVVFGHDLSSPTVKDCYFEYYTDLDIDEEKFTRELEYLNVRNHGRTYYIKDLSPLGAPLTADSIAEKLGASDLASMFCLMGDSNYFICSDAAAVQIEGYSGNTEELGRYNVRIAVRPVNDAIFRGGFMDIMGPLCNVITAEYDPAYSDFDYCYTLDYFMQVKKTADGKAFTVSYGYTLESFEEQP